MQYRLGRCPPPQAAHHMAIKTLELPRFAVPPGGSRHFPRSAKKIENIKERAPVLAGDTGAERAPVLGGGGCEPRITRSSLSSYHAARLCCPVSVRRLSFLPFVGVL